jgi:hypothetical protein
MQEEIGIMAGAIWRALNTKGELSVAQLKKAVNGKAPVFDWAVGWLAREEKIVIAQEKRSCRIRLNEAEAGAVRATAKAASAN